MSLAGNSTAGRRFCSRMITLFLVTRIILVAKRTRVMKSMLVGSSH